MRINRFVLDNNIWISYFITRSEQKLIDIIADNDLVVFSCEELIKEVRNVLAYSHIKKFNVNTAYALKIIHSITVFHRIIYPIKRYIPDDPDDDYLVALALQTNSGFITSGDNHILKEKENLEKKFTKLHILTKTEFESRFA